MHALTQLWPLLVIVVAAILIPATPEKVKPSRRQQVRRPGDVRRGSDGMLDDYTSLSSMQGSHGLDGGGGGTFDGGGGSGECTGSSSDSGGGCDSGGGGGDGGGGGV